MRPNPVCLGRRLQRFHPIYNHAMTAREPPKSLMRSLGEFVGHIVHSAKTDPTDPKRTIVSKTTQEQIQQTPEGPVTLRRTTIEEIEYPEAPHRES